MTVEIALAAGIITLIFAVFTAFRVLRYQRGNETMIKISQATQEGASAFLKREYRFLVVFIVVLALILYAFISAVTAASFVFGAFLSALAGFFGMKIATKANVMKNVGKFLMPKAVR